MEKINNDDSVQRMSIVYNFFDRGEYFLFLFERLYSIFLFF